jgi:hypothetical protein
VFDFYALEVDENNGNTDTAHLVIFIQVTYIVLHVHEEAITLYLYLKVTETLASLALF